MLSFWQLLFSSFFMFYEVLGQPIVRLRNHNRYKQVPIWISFKYFQLISGLYILLKFNIRPLIWSIINSNGKTYLQYLVMTIESPSSLKSLQKEMKTGYKRVMRSLALPSLLHTCNTNYNKEANLAILKLVWI